MRPRKAKPLPQGSYGQRSPRRVTESLRADHHPIRPEWLASGGTADKRTTTRLEPTTCGYDPVLLRPGDGGKGDGCGDFPSNGGGRRVAANRPHRPCSVAPTIMVTVLPACLGRQGRHVVTSRPHAVSMTEPSQLAGSPDLTTPAELIGVHGLIGVSPDCTRGDTPRPDSTRGFRAL
ncbi:hypothetical protein PCANC_14343 [Puccinia coronata f. sp. avenae]|uniref:Uncharacterized protein n=1 Tax=Puccinia coronata f. sp. avenae TaxID=200324 RepID=A0A2N5SR19_9BASI|nr:hypothetical protein PCANC_14343 [Puccinia coronata f. sp. avenae]